MITYDWVEELPSAERPEVAALLAEAAAEDLEGGFPVLSPLGADKDRHLLVKLLPDERAGVDDEILAAYLRLTPRDDGTHAAEYVVRPRFRSRGITTLLMERMGVDTRTHRGWVNTGATSVSVWATGDHPAAQRIARRFRRTGLRATRRDWHLLAPVRDTALPADAHPASPAERAQAEEWFRGARPFDEVPTAAQLLVVAGGAVYVDPTATAETEYGTSGQVLAVLTPPDNRSQETLSILLTTGMSVLADAGLRVAGVTVWSKDEELVHVCRALDFSHYRTDTEYTVA